MTEFYLRVFRGGSDDKRTEKSLNNDDTDDVLWEKN